MSTYLVHYGIDGMHWGIRNGPPYPLNKSRYKIRLKTGEMDEDVFIDACRLWRTVEEYPGLTYSEKEHVYEEFDNNLSKEEKNYSIVARAIGNFLYTAVNKGHNQYKIFGKERIEQSNTWEDKLSDILDEVVGPDWRKYE